MLTRIGKYEILRRLGHGAMGEVFLARDPLIGREVAVKTIAASHDQGEEARERFLREARAAGALSHANLVTIHEFGEDQGLLYLVMEYVPGEDLHGLLALKALRPRELLEVLAQVCDGLGYAHSKGVLHRDIKPSNIRVARVGGRLHAKVMDFGIARITGSDFTGTGTLLGTFGYMAPEYIQTGRPDPRSDLFAVGVILHEALAGDRPFKGDTTATVLYRIVHDAPPPIDPRALEGVSPALAGVLATALAKEPADRFPTAETMAAALRAAMDPGWAGFAAPTAKAAQEMLPTTRLRAEPGTPLPAPAPAPPRRRAGGWFAGGLAVVAAAAGVAFWPRPRPAAVAEPVPSASPAAAAAVAAPPLPVKAASTAPPASAPAPTAAAPAPAAAAKAQPTAVLRPEPARPAPALPGSLDEAARILDQDPGAALRYLDRFLAEDPRNARAWALKLAAHYQADDFDGFSAGFRALQAQGIPRRAILAVPRLRAVIARERAQPKLPPALRELIREGGPPEAPEAPPKRPFRRPKSVF